MMQLDSLIAPLNARLVGGNTQFEGLATDSREPLKGSLFVALKGEHFDGHQFLHQAQVGGAVAVVVERVQTGLNISQLVVADSRLALGHIAKHIRRAVSIPVVGITGSNGKTTVKELVAAIFRQHWGPDAVLATSGNFNNDIGLPLTLGRLRPQHQAAVLEMGMSASGEIAYLVQLAQPTIGLVNNAHAAHVAGLGSIETIARAKGEMFEHLAADATAVVAVDSPFYGLWRGLIGQRRSLGFGHGPSAEVRAQQLSCGSTGSQFVLQAQGRQVAIHLPLVGVHNVDNALAASAVAVAAGIELESIAEALAHAHAAKQRLNLWPLAGGIELIDDSYNANPASFKAAIAVLADRPGTRVLVAGDMGELGQDAADYHHQVGRWAREAGIDQLWLIGSLMSQHAAAGFGPAGLQVFSDKLALVDKLKQSWGNGWVVLVKGSRFMRMDEVVAALRKR